MLIILIMCNLALEYRQLLCACHTAGAVARLHIDKGVAMCTGTNKRNKVKKTAVNYIYVNFHCDCAGETDLL
jgi:hypothetical protein